MNNKKLIWHTEERKINTLIPYEGNPRQMTQKQKEDLEESLKRFNLMSIPVVNTDNVIVSGHQRLKILQLLGRGEETIDVRLPNRELTPEELREANLRENKNLGSWDYDMLANLDEDLLMDVGFGREELDDIFGLDINEEFDVDKELEKFIKEGAKRVKSGDLWRLGEHKLFIGDCTDKNVWSKLFGKERFDFMFTDPPYFNIKKFGHKKFSYKSVENKKVPKDYDSWLSIAIGYQHSKGSNVMVFEKWKNIVRLWLSIEKYWKIKNMIIWKAEKRYQSYIGKKTFPNRYDVIVLGDNGEVELNEEYEEELDKYLKEKGQKFLDTYEVIIYGQKGNSYFDKRKKTRWSKITDHITWSAEQTGRGRIENIIFGKKPIQILVPYIKILSPRDGIIAEPFCGSGSTLIACEIMKRRCRAIEIEPIYGEVILARWEKFTGKTAVKLKSIT